MSIRSSGDVAWEIQMIRLASDEAALLLADHQEALEDNLHMVACTHIHTNRHTVERRLWRLFWWDKKDTETQCLFYMPCCLSLA